jgi:integrase
MSHLPASRALQEPRPEGIATGHSPFVAPGIPTFADLLERVHSDPDLTQQRRADLRSAVRGFARLMGQEPALMPALPSLYRRRLAGLNPAATGLSAKRLANIKADVMHCLRRYGAVKRRNALPGLDPAWQVLWTDLTVFERCQLSRFARWCSAMAIPPTGVDDQVAARFQADLVAESFLRDPEGLVQQARHAWNRVRDRTPGETLQPLAIPRRRDTYGIPVTAFPARFQAELDAYCRHLAGADPLAEDGPVRALRPASVKRIRGQILQLAAGLIHAGPREPADIASLADLITPTALKTSLGFFLARAGNQSTVQISMLAAMALNIGRHWLKLDPATLEAIQRLARKVAVRQRDMTEKNHERLRQFDDPGNLERLLFYADDLFRELVQRDDHSRDAALQAQTAIAVELLIAAPIRSHNLVALQLDVHVLRSHAANGAVWYLVITADQTKNRKRLEFRLSERLVGLLRIYLEQYRPLLAEPGNAFLFPSGTGHLATSSLAARLKASVFRRTGLRVNPHLFRHFAGKLILTARPGAYGVVEHVLGHRDPTTTRTFYTGTETAAATRHFDALVQETRAQLRPGKGAR